MAFGGSRYATRSDGLLTCFRRRSRLQVRRLQLTETRLKAWPNDHFYDEGAARADLEPSLHGWAASAEVVDQVRMEISFLDAEMRAIAAVSMYATARLQVGGSDFAAIRDDLEVIEVVLEQVPAPVWRGDSSVAKEAREYCLRPMRDSGAPSRTLHTRW